MLGDELSGGMMRSNYSAITDVIHEELDGTEHFVYTNESPHVSSQAVCCCCDSMGLFARLFLRSQMYLGPTVPSGIDVISFDGYGICETPGTCKQATLLVIQRSSFLWQMDCL